MDLDFDLEAQSQTSRSSGGKEPKPLEEWVGTTMHPDKARLWESHIGTKPIGPRGHYNPHGLLAAQRFVAERKAADILLAEEGTIVVDVGAAPHRTHEYLATRGRYLMPNVHPGDRTRIGRCPPDARGHVCHDRFEECRCHEGQKRAYLFTHSAYYIEPLALWTTLCDSDVTDALVIEHVFDDAYGGYYGEAHWAVEADMVKMSVVGNASPYVHRLPPWQAGWVGPEGESFGIETLLELDSVTRVIRVQAIKQVGPSERPMTWGEVEADPLRAGPVQFSSAAKAAVADNARFTQVTFDVHAVRKIGPFVYTDYVFRGETVRLTLPITGVGQVAFHVGNRPRTPELLSEVTHIMKNRYARSRIPSGRSAQMLTAMIALGFVCNLQNEVDVNYTMLNRFTWAMKTHSVVLQFGTLAVRSWPYLVCLSLLLVVPFIPLEVIDHNVGERIGLALAAVLAPLLCFFCTCGAVRLHQGWRSYVTSNWTQSLASEESPTSPLLGNGTVMQRNTPIPGSRYIRPPLEEVQGRLSLGATRERTSEPDRMLVSGIVSDGAVPLALATTQAAELSAVTNRVLAPRNNPDETCLKAYQEAFGRPEFTSVEKGVDTSQVAVMKWLNKLRDSYPAVYITNLLECWKQYQGAMPPPAATKGFLKIEKSGQTIGVDGGKSTKPRLIQPPEDLDKVVTGPVVWQMYDRVRDAWDGVKCGVLYATGRSLAYVGERVQAFIDKWSPTGKIVAWSVDMASYDSTLGLHMQEPAFAFYKTLGMPTWMIEWIMRTRSRGVTPNGVKYTPTRVWGPFGDEKEAETFANEFRKKKFKVYGVRFHKHEQCWYVEIEDYQMVSGRMDTNLTDTVCLVAALLSVMRPEIPYLLLACGDDGFLMIREEDKGVIDDIAQQCRGLGLKPEGVVSDRRSDWEFCSKLFWYAKDEKGNDITVLGSKPFRGIARMGVNTTLPGAANAAASAQAVVLTVATYHS